SSSAPLPRALARFPYTTLFRSDQASSTRLQRPTVRRRAHGWGSLRPVGRAPRARATAWDAWLPGSIRSTSSPILGSPPPCSSTRSEEHTSELQSRFDLLCRHLL